MQSLYLPLRISYMKLYIPSQWGSGENAIHTIPSIDSIPPPKYHIRWRLMCCTPKSPRMFDLQSQCQCVVLTVLDAWTKRFRWNSGSIPSVSLGFICSMAFNEFWNSCAYLQTIDVIKRMHNFFLQRKMIRQILLTINYNF